MLTKLEKKREIRTVAQLNRFRSSRKLVNIVNFEAEFNPGHKCHFQQLQRSYRKRGLEYDVRIREFRVVVSTESTMGESDQP